MKDTKKKLNTAVDRVLKAIDALLLVEVRSEDPARFTRIAQLAQQAKFIKSHYATKVSDVEPPGEGNFMEAPLMEAPLYVDTHPVMNMGRVAVHNGQPDFMEMLRELIMTAQRLQTRTPSLLDLLDARDRLEKLGRDVTGIDAQIADLSQPPASQPVITIPVAGSNGNGVHHDD